MAFSRAAAFRSCFRSARPTAARPQLFRQVARRGYASGGHESTKAGGDTIWAVGAIAVTVPTCWYLLQSAPDTSHGHGDHGDSHGKSHGKAHGKEAKEETKDDGEGEEKAEEKSEDSEGDKDSEKSDDSGSDDGAKEADTPDTSDDEGEKGIKQGDDAKDSEDGEGVKDKPATSKPAGSKNTQSGKQEGLSNTDTKHSTDLTKDPNKSKKGEGTPESAKAKGTVNPSRPQPEKK